MRLRFTPMPAEVCVGQILEIRGRVLRVVGFDPMGVADRHFDLEDCMNGKLVRLPVDDVERAAARTAAAA
jgi:hypothetical protein